ncbi:MAG TPA: SusC/RagA family TonB-linked outer membrane protein [Gemmatimonadaceae bacterium]|jgi:TonB-linked SusC/RagA family outer membrane protein|nr:SusC/RagA family TonB-linked outer membrane protein [Gemmatimonadaceae bacterium]HPV73989.1 SusC/RagA family TonB-linked outer membrane protein [Gemmatimonadaceae bacterium]
MHRFRLDRRLRAYGLALTLALLGTATTRAEAQQPQVTGRVTASDVNEPLSDVRVIVLGTSVFTVTNAQGNFTLRGLPAGSYEVRVLRVGYQEQKKSVAVTASGPAVALNFAMVRTVVQLQAVVTTATGEQRRVELGNSVATIDAAKTVESGSVKNMGDLLVAKAAGVQILPSNMTAGGSRVRIRGTSSLSLSNDPIYVIDGVRMTSTGGTGIGVGGTAPSRVNDINPEEIENIEVVKGPSAATLYGTDAANGVVVITTKRGRAGAARWSVYGEQGVIQDKNDYPTTYAILGHLPATPTVARRCWLYETALGTCIEDSTSALNLFKDKDLTPIKDGWRWQGGAQVSGGTDAVRYFVSGEYESEAGPLSIPDYDRRRFDSLQVRIYDYMNRPNVAIKGSYRANINITPNPKLDLGVTSNFIKLDQRLPQVDNNVNSFWYNGTVGYGYKNAGPNYTSRGSLGQPLQGWNLFTPGDIFQYSTQQEVQRAINSATANWRPFSWLQNRADVGLDLSDRVDFQLCRFGECSDFGTNRLGRATDVRANIRNITINLGSTATWQFKPWLNFKTTGGAQYVNFAFETATAQGSTLPPGAETPAAGTIPAVGSGTTLTKTLGVFVEEQASINDRLFLTAAVRTDQNSAFGTEFQRVYYPKGSLSWIISDESFFPKLSWLSSLRLRSAYGASGVQPGPNDALRTFAVVTTNIAGSEVAGLRSNLLGNAALKPERTAELEFGTDARFFNDRVSLELTYYDKKSKDALIAQTIAPSAGSAATTVLANLGEVRNWGYEALLNAQVLSGRNLAWDVTLSASRNSNELLTLGTDAAGKPIPPIIGTSTQQRPGFPLNGYWQRGFSYNDANKDGIIVPAEVTIADSITFQGYSQPRLELTFVNGFDLFNRRLRISSLIDHKSGYKVLNSEQQFLCQQSLSCKATSSHDATPYEQARAIAQRFKTPQTTAGYMEDVTFTRIRELSATYNVESAWAQRLLKAQSVGLVFAVRNLAVFTDWTGVDPEQNYGEANLQQTLLTAGPPRYFTFRVNLRY